VESYDDGAFALSGGTLAVLVEEGSRRGLGVALATARARSAGTVHILCGDEPGLIARRAGEFVSPPEVWEVRGRELTPAFAEPHRPSDVPDPAALALVPTIVGAGAEPVIEHGVITAEVQGLEIARVIVDADGARLEVGVGRHDREAFAIIHGREPVAVALARVAAEVGDHRRPGAEPHPLNRIGAERWLRARLIASPRLIGARVLEAGEPPLPRENVKEATPAVAVGRAEDGSDLVVVTSVGIDLDLVPFAADARLRLAPGARLVIVVPRRDVHPITRDLAGSLMSPAEIVSVPDDWRDTI